MATKSIAKRKGKLSEGAKLERLYNTVKKAPAQLTEQDLMGIERTANKAETHMWRRAALASFMMSGADLAKQLEDREAAVVYAGLTYGIQDYLKRQKALAGMIESALQRLQFMLCAREDMDAVLAEARADYEAEQAEPRRTA